MLRPTASTRPRANTTGLGESWLSGPRAYRIVDRARTPRWPTREGDAAVPLCVVRVGRACWWGVRGMTGHTAEPCQAQPSPHMSALLWLLWPSCAPLAASCHLYTITARDPVLGACPIGRVRWAAPGGCRGLAYGFTSWGRRPDSATPHATFSPWPTVAIRHC